MSLQIKNKVVLISGGASGLGLGAALHFQSLGAVVVVLDVDQQKLDNVIEQHHLHGFHCDITSDQQLNQIVRQVQTNFNAIHAVINCAGIVTGERLVKREGVHKMSVFEKIMSVNVIGSFNLMRLTAQVMSEQAVLNEDGERGVIINTSSVAATDGQIGQVAYSASKGAVAAMTLPAARELARFGIRVMCIAPGIMNTPMMQGFTDQVQQSLHESVPFPKRMGHVEEFASLAAQMVSNPYLNGETIRLDGAIRMAEK